MSNVFWFFIIIPKNNMQPRRDFVRKDEGSKITRLFFLKNPGFSGICN